MPKQACLVQCSLLQQYLILKQTLRSPEANQARDEPSLCPDHGGQGCEKAGSRPGPPLEDQSYRTTREPDHVDDSCWRLRSQPHKTPEILATTDKTTAGAKYRDLCYRQAGPQLPTPLDNQAIGKRLTKEPVWRTDLWRDLPAADKTTRGRDPQRPQISGLLFWKGQDTAAHTP